MATATLPATEARRIILATIGGKTGTGGALRWLLENRLNVADPREVIEAADSSARPRRGWPDAGEAARLTDVATRLEAHYLGF
jgi:hypothetical protein